MRHREKHYHPQREHHPLVGIGLFLITLGVALLIATNDVLGLGSVGEYFTWETAMVFIGVLLLLNLHFVPGILLAAGGTWFLLDEFYVDIPDLVRNTFWPAVLVLIGISYIISSFFKRSGKI